MVGFVWRVCRGWRVTVSEVAELSEVRRVVWERALGRCECECLHAGAAGSPHDGGRCHARFPLAGDFRLRLVDETLPFGAGNAVLLCQACARLHS